MLLEGMESGSKHGIGSRHVQLSLILAFVFLNAEEGVKQIENS